MYFKYTVFILGLALYVQADDVGLNQWKMFKAEYGKSFADQVEEQRRMDIYLENREKIEEHNSRHINGLVSFTLKMNKYGDMSNEEFTKTMNGYRMGQESKGTVFVPPNSNVSESVDWRENNVVTPVKDQGKCGSCWAFSTTGSLEGQHALNSGQLVSLSEQNLLDCSWLYLNFGCMGGQMSRAFKYIKHNGGIDTEASYPYTAAAWESCSYNAVNSGATDTGSVSIAKNEDDLKSAVATVGPISIAIDASQDSFRFYDKGVYFEPDCSSSSLDHGVLVVGYGTDESGQEYWLVKNSWGSDWGEEGYIKMARNRDNHCGIASSALYPTV